ncbi:hypothetical protein ABTF05_21640, partial [Acinetobacter baumannii]
VRDTQSVTCTAYSLARTERSIQRSWQYLLHQSQYDPDRNEYHKLSQMIDTAIDRLRLIHPHSHAVA